METPFPGPHPGDVLAGSENASEGDVSTSGDKPTSGVRVLFVPVRRPDLHGQKWVPRDEVFDTADVVAELCQDNPDNTIIVPSGGVNLHYAVNHKKIQPSGFYVGPPRFREADKFSAIIEQRHGIVIPEENRDVEAATTFGNLVSGLDKIRELTDGGRPALDVLEISEPKLALNSVAIVIARHRIPRFAWNERIFWRDTGELDVPIEYIAVEDGSDVVQDVDGAFEAHEDTRAVPFIDEVHTAAKELGTSPLEELRNKLYDHPFFDADKLS